MDLKDAALKYAQHGYRVLPVWWLEDGECACGEEDCEVKRSQGKHPIIKAWQKIATLKPEKIEHWWKRWPHAHVGIMPPEGVVLLDIDPRNGGEESLDELRHGKQLPKTVVQRSGGGGMHILFKGDVQISKREYPGIDVRRYGRGFVVAWPSAHISGGKYTWRNAPWDSPVAKLPAGLGQVARSAVAPEFGAVAGNNNDAPAPPTVDIEIVRAALAHVDSSDRIQWVNVGQALKHAFGEEGRELWETWSRTSPDHDFNDADARLWDESFDKNRDRPLLTLRSIMRIARLGGYRPLVTEFDKGIWTKAAIDGYFDKEPQPITWAFEGIMPCGRVTVMAGAGGSSKSFLTLMAAMQFCTGQDLGPFKPGCTGKVLVITGEDDKDDIHRRIYAVNETAAYTKGQKAAIEERLGVLTVRGLDWRMMSHDELGDLQETERAQYLIDEIRALGDVRLLVLDPLVAFNGGNENDNAEMSRLMFTFDRVAKATGVAMLVIHHANKSGGNAGLDEMEQGIVRGASALVDNARSAMLLVRMPRKDAVMFGIAAEDAGRYVVVRFMKNNYGPHMPDAIFAVGRGGALRYAPEIHKVHTTAAEANKAIQSADARTRLLECLAGGGVLGATEIMEDTGCAHRTVQRLLEEFTERGYVTPMGGVGKGRRYKVTKRGIGEAASGKKRPDAMQEFGGQDD